MAHTRAFSSPISTGEKCSAAAFNQLDDGQYFALCRNGASTLTANCTVTMGSYTLTFDGNTCKFSETPQYTSAQTVYRSQAGYPVAYTDIGFDVTNMQWQQTATGGFVIFPVSNLVDKGAIINVQVSLKGGAFGALPGTMPVISLIKRNALTAASTTLSTKTDAATPVATFNAVHTVTTDDISEGIDQENPHRYYIRVDGAAGSNYTNGLAIIGIRVKFSVTKIVPGG